MRLPLSPRVRQVLSAIGVLAAVLLVNRVLKPGFRQDVTVRLNMGDWHDRGLTVRAVEVCVFQDAAAVCSTRRNLAAVPPRVVTATLRLPEGDVRVDVRVEGEDSVQEASRAAHVSPGASLELLAPPPR